METLRECAINIHNTIFNLIEFDSSFSVWYPTVKQKKNKNIVSLNIDNISIERHLLNGAHIDDLGCVINDLGYLFSLKSEIKYTAAHILSFTCASTEPSLTNCVTLEIKGRQLKEIKDEKAITLIFEKLSEIWKPDRKVMNVERSD